MSIYKTGESSLERRASLAGRHCSPNRFISNPSSHSEPTIELNHPLDIDSFPMDESMFDYNSETEEVSLPIDDDPTIELERPRHT